MFFLNVGFSTISFLIEIFWFCWNLGVKSSYFSLIAETVPSILATKLGNKRNRKHKDRKIHQLVPSKRLSLVWREGATLTQDVDPHAEAALAGPVPGHALVDPRVVHRHDLDDERVKTLFTHQHLVVVVGTDGLAVQVPADVGGREASHLVSEEVGLRIY